MSGYASYEDALDPKYGDPFPVPTVMATEESLKGYGTIVNNFEETKVEITPWPVKGSANNSTLFTTKIPIAIHSASDTRCIPRPFLQK